MTNQNAYVWIRPVSNFRNLWIPLAFNLARDYGLRPLFIVSTIQDQQFYQSESKAHCLDVEFAIVPSLYEIAMSASAEEMSPLIQKANYYEKRFDISLLRDVMQGDRHFGRGMVWGWNGQPNSKVANKSTDAGKIAACLRSFEFYESLLASKPPEIVLGFGLGTGLFSKPIPLLCREKKIPFRSLSSSRIGGYFYWSVDEFNNSPQLEAVVKRHESEISLNGESLKQLPEASSIYTYFSQKGGDRRSFMRAVKGATHQLVMRLYHQIKGYQKSRFGYYAFSSAMSVINQWWEMNRTEHKPFVDMRSINQYSQIVLFPLQYEFEASLYGESPEANSLLLAVYETAISLPLGVVLAVKEHPLQPGRRPNEFYKKISQLPNVVLLKPSLNTQQVLEKSRAVVQINSSLGYEAVVQGIPVFSFSRHGPIQASSNNTQIRKSEDLNLLRDFLLEQDNTAKFERRRATGTAYVSAIEEFCFSIPKIQKIVDGEIENNDLSEMLDALDLKDGKKLIASP